MTAGKHRPRWTAVFGAPLIVGVLSLAGLLSALLAGDFGRYFCWIAVALPVAIVTIVWLRPRFRRD
ncbi:hypothetical protein JQ604_00210 [Bradyrhizobium jicamae]|uniref:hypothetical protein n=1 Tax=Bradyrhizobium jicamae TaxID=280332 RepID=UPI001BA5D95C|nr:hypothetical protein [Bradyrhizobium jicamae]MBR0750599.1 hypothetical protein [Bradyrhizobium jicamae]